LLEALDDTPTVLIHGPRQSGKTTLIQRIARVFGQHICQALFRFFLWNTAGVRFK